MSTLTCPCCGNDHLHPLYSATLPLGDNGDAEPPQPFELAVCEGCGLSFQTTAYSDRYDQVMARAYQSYTVNSAFPFPDRGTKNAEPLTILLNHLPADQPLSILEIGSNRGDLLYLLREQRPQYNVLGIEPTRFRDLKVPTLNALFRADLFASRFDVISMVHVLEHLKDPVTILRDISSLLNPGGWLYLEVPDLDLGLDHFIEDFIPDHVVYYSYRTLRDLVGDAFEDVHLERTTFLRLLLRKRRDVLTNETSNVTSMVGPARATVSELASKFQAFSRQKVQMINELTAAAPGKRVVFYGASYYFARLYRELRDRLSQSQCFFWDDNLTSDHEPRFQLPRLVEPLTADDVVILASNNFCVQDRMAINLLSKLCPARMLKPWRGFSSKAYELTI